jgi:hypothetical protein
LVNTREEHVLRDVLGRIGDKAPDAVPFDELDVLDLRPASRKPHSLTLWVAAAAVFVGAVSLFSATPKAPVAAPDEGILMVPSFIPENLTLNEAVMSDADGYSTEESSEAIAASMTYLLPEESTWVEGDRALIIHSEDRLAQVEAVLARDEVECFQTIDGEEEPVDPETCRNQVESSPCSGSDAIEARSLNTEQCIQELARSDSTLSASFEEITIRGNPAVLIEQANTVSGVEHYSYTVAVFEGGPVLTTVTGHQLQRDVVLRVAESLRPATAAEFFALDG